MVEQSRHRFWLISPSIRAVGLVAKKQSRAVDPQIVRTNHDPFRNTVATVILFGDHQKHTFEEYLLSWTMPTVTVNIHASDFFKCPV